MNAVILSKTSLTFSSCIRSLCANWSFSKATYSKHAVGDPQSHPHADILSSTTDSLFCLKFCTNLLGLLAFFFIPTAIETLRHLLRCTLEVAELHTFVLRLGLCDLLFPEEPIKAKRQAKRAHCIRVPTG